jgi:hypothetical protein
MQALLGISCTKYRFVLHTVDTGKRLSTYKEAVSRQVRASAFRYTGGMGCAVPVGGSSPSRRGCR